MNRLVDGFKLDNFVSLPFPLIFAAAALCITLGGCGELNGVETVRRGTSSSTDV